jgi:osmotically inducible lipoprotein OsmB
MVAKSGLERSSLVALMGLFCLTGCSVPPNPVQAGIVGGGIGAGTGVGVAALTSGSIAAGAAIGGGVGLLAGVATGVIMDQQDVGRGSPDFRARMIENHRMLAQQDQSIKQEHRELEEQYLHLTPPSERTVRYEYIGASRANPYR